MICPNCGEEMIWGGDADADEIGYEEKGIVSNYSCQHCGTDAEVFTPEKKHKAENDFEVGDYVVYIRPCGVEIGKIKRIVEDGAFVWYSSGETAAKTPFHLMRKIKNQETIKKTILGGY